MSERRAKVRDTAAAETSRCKYPFRDNVIMETENIEKVDGLADALFWIKFPTWRNL